MNDTLPKFHKSSQVSSFKIIFNIFCDPDIMVRPDGVLNTVGRIVLFMEKNSVLSSANG